MEKFTKKEILYQVQRMDNSGAVATTGKRNNAILDAIDRLVAINNRWCVHFLTDKELVTEVYRFLNENNQEAGI